MEDLPQLTGTAVVAMIVNNQPIVIGVDGTNAPITAGNFVDLVERDVYDGTSFHRVVLTPRPFVVQGGDPLTKDPNVPANLYGTGGFVDPATNEIRQIPLEIKPQGATEPIYSQTLETAGINTLPILQNLRGTLAMARSDDPDSASSQFYFNLSDSAFLDGNYAVFGQVLRGLEVVDQIRQGDRIIDAEVVGGVIPGRTSSIIRDVTTLNQFINIVNLAGLPLGFAQLSPNDDQVTITPQVAQQNPRGVFAGTGNDQIIGSTIDDVVNGNQGDDTISGEAGNDFLRGGRGNDLLAGGPGNDMLIGNLGNDQLQGGIGNDFLRGGRDNDQLLGGEGDDYLLGELGSDTLTGGAGADTFTLRIDDAVNPSNATLADRITDLNVTQGDQIRVIGLTNITDLQFNPLNNDTVIQLATGSILGIVNQVPPNVVQSATFPLVGEDDALGIA